MVGYDAFTSVLGELRGAQRKEAEPLRTSPELDHESGYTVTWGKAGRGKTFQVASLLGGVLGSNNVRFILEPANNFSS